MNKGLVISILVVLILLAFGRGIRALGEKSLWWDESLSLQRAQGSLEQVLTNEILLTDGETSLLTIDNHPPLYFLLVWASVRLFGESEFALRFVSLGFAVLLVPLFYVTGKRLVDERTGMVAAALGALSAMYLWYGQEARMYTMLASVGLLSFYCLVRALFDHGEPWTLRSRWPWVVAFVGTSLGLMLIHYLSALLIAFETMALCWILLRRSVSRRTIGLIIAAVAGGVLPLLAYALAVLPLQVSVPGLTFVPLGVLLRDLLNSFSLGLWADVGKWNILLVDLLFLLVAIVGFVVLVRRAAPSRWRAAGWLLAGYLLVPVVLIYLLSLVRPAYMTSRHLIFVSPPFTLLMAVGLTRWRGWSLGVAALVGLSILVALGYSTVSYFSSTVFAKPDHRAWGEYLRAQVRQGDVVIVDPPQIAELYQYYGASDVPWIGLPLLRSTREQSEAKLEELLSVHDRVWLAISSTPEWGDPEGLPGKWLDEHAFAFDLKLFHSDHSLLQVAGYQRDWPSTHRLTASVGEQIRFLGYDLDSNSIEAGGILSFTLYWQALSRMDTSYTVFTHFLDDDDRKWGQKDGLPMDGSHPTTEWQPREVIVDPYSFVVSPEAPPGNYRLAIGLYNLESGVRLPVLDADGNPLGHGRIVIAEVAVESPTVDVQDEIILPSPEDLDSVIFLPLVFKGAFPR